jgi:tRNA1(Val) A37 N6-methylase TrmN6
VPPGAEDDPDLAPAPGESLDCLSGHWRIFQLRRGHRYSTDDLLTAWAAAHAGAEAGLSPRTCLDLGSGIGSVLLLLLWRFPELSGVGVEAQPESAALARRSLRYNGAAHRADVRCADFRSTGALAPSERFDLVTGSPPYLAANEGRRSDRPQRGPCRFEDRGDERGYLAAAAAHLAPRGVVAWVHATRYTKRNIEAAAATGLGLVRVRRVVFRKPRESLISLFTARLGHPGPVEEEPPLVIRRTDAEWSEEYREIRREMGFPG